MIERRGILIVIVLLVSVVRHAFAVDVPASVQLAQFGDMTKKPGTPAPRRTPDGTDGRDQRGENAQRPGSPFGSMQK